MSGASELLYWLLLVSVPFGLALAGFWAHGRLRDARPKVPPGDPGNPT